MRFGLVVQTSNNISIDQNWVMAIYNRGLKVKNGGDTQGGIVACGHNAFDKCNNIRVTNNIVSSMQGSNVDSAAYSAPHHECDDYNTVVFRDNIAHSI
jgi:hypothetical protein